MQLRENMYKESCRDMLFTKSVCWAHFWAVELSGRSAVTARTVRACAESVRVLDFLRDLLAKPTELTREPTCKGSRPPLYIDEGLRPIEPPQSIQSTLLVIFTLCSRSSPSLAFLHHESSSLFDSMPTRGVLGGRPTPRHTLGSPLPDGSLPGGEI
jgi:hypothetical protein